MGMAPLCYSPAALFGYWRSSACVDISMPPPLTLDFRSRSRRWAPLTGLDGSFCGQSVCAWAVPGWRLSFLKLAFRDGWCS